MKNETFSGIVFLAIKNSDEEEYPSNFFAEGERLDDGAEGILYYTYGDPEALYNVKVQFDDGSIHYMTGVPFEDMESARILWEDDTLFTIYQSKSSGGEISTKETEQEWQGILRGEYPDYYEEEYSGEGE